MTGITFVTGNRHKVLEAQDVIGDLEQRALDLEEIQSLEIEDVVKHKLAQAMKEIGGPCIVEDSALSVKTLGGLPGPFVKHFLQAMGPDGIARIAEGSAATGECVIGYFDGEHMQILRGTVSGTIVSPDGESGFGWDPIFRPDGEERTFARMSQEEKGRISHRGQAFRKLAEYMEKTPISTHSHFHGGVADAKSND